MSRTFFIFFSFLFNVNYHSLLVYFYLSIYDWPTC